MALPPVSDALNEVLILTGMSGAGKSLAANYLEDMGYFCIDNLPPYLIPELVETFARRGACPDGSVDACRLAFVIDVRSNEHLVGILPALRQLDQLSVPYRILFLDAPDDILLSRYKQSRRNHPLADGKGIAAALREERERLQPLREIAWHVINTGNRSTSDLRDYLYKILSDGSRDERMTVLVQSFGFKYGIPVDCDCVLDVRFIPNPFYLENLRPLSGLDAEIKTFVFTFPETNRFLDLQEQFFSFVIPFYVREGKVRLTIGVGCTGGRHRSVALAEELARRLRNLGSRVVVDHRDVEKDPLSAKSAQANGSAEPAT